MKAKIPITKMSTEYRAVFLFSKTYWFPFGVYFDWAK